MRFFTPGRIHFGWSSSNAVSELEGRVAVISGHNVWSSVRDYLNVNGEVYLLSRSTSTGEPIEDDVMKIVEFLKETTPEVIIAVGGGSVIDSAKLARVFYVYPHIGWSDVYSANIPSLSHSSSFVAIETTSGTGTGISAAAVVIDGRGVKHGVVSPELIPDMAIYDPALVLTMPRKVAIYSGMDALTHAIEAYVSRIDNIPADTLALKAIDLIFTNLPMSVDGLEEPRAMVHYGNMMAAMGFANSRLGLCHAASHKIGGRIGMEHGKVNAILLPHFIRATRKYTSRFETIEKMLNVDDLASAIEDINDVFGIPRHIPEIEEYIDTIVGEIMADPLMRTNPGEMSSDEIRDFLLKVANVV